MLKDIELRYAVRLPKSVRVAPYRVLQYRKVIKYFGDYDEVFHGWTDWEDVPVVNEEK